MFCAPMFLILVVFALVSCGAHKDIALDKKCTLLSSGAKGKCRLLKECPEVFNGIKKGIFPQTCPSEDNLVVCCVIQPGEISRQKCIEYSVYAFNNNSKICPHKSVPLIVGGDLANDKEFPHMAALGYKTGNSDNIEFKCGGSLISPQFVLTAAHCVNTFGFTLSLIRIGVTDVTSTRHRQDFNFTELIQYPNYTRKSHYNDIALIKLEKPVIFNQHARPACLYTTTHLPEKVMVTGWGYTKEIPITEDFLPNELMKVTLKILDYVQCNKRFSSISTSKLKMGIIPEMQICAASDTNKSKDSCQGDSGGPIQIYHHKNSIKCMYDIVGITSFGPSEACYGKAGVYTRVSHYIEWIENIVWPEDQ